MCLLMSAKYADDARVRTLWSWRLDRDNGFYQKKAARRRIQSETIKARRSR